MPIAPATNVLRTAKALILSAGLVLAIASSPAKAQVTAYKQAVAEAAASDDGIAAFYRSNNYQPLWTGQGEQDRARRAALLDALTGVERHGLPAERYQAQALLTQMRDAHTTRDIGLVEVALSRAFVTYASNVQSGILIPSKIDAGLVRKVTYRDRNEYLDELATSSNPAAYMRSLPPVTAEYRALMKEKLRLEALMKIGGWGPKTASGALKPGQSGAAVVALRNRLIAMGYMAPGASLSYDKRIENAVQKFQLEHGLDADGVAGKGTIDEINKPVSTRLKSVIVAMERERWLTRDRGERHVLVNQTDFTARIVDKGHITFQTRSVIGKNTADRRSPEFSDVMEHMIINPSWHVPRSIVTKEYLPQMKNNPNAAGHLVLTDSRGRRVSRENIDFSQYTNRSFPFAMTQPPGGRNALGLVKFMFPNKHNIYLHDTPSKSLFNRESRAFSHGCIRLADPFDFAYALLAKQVDNPKEYFQSILNTRKETKVVLEQPVPVHLIYRTAFATNHGQIEFRRDMYGRDAKIWSALNDAGVALSDVQG
jgi:murein L,D-transpeptidase YcbB/YkuD